MYICGVEARHKNSYTVFGKVNWLDIQTRVDRATRYNFMSFVVLTVKSYDCSNFPNSFQVCYTILNL